MRKFLAVTAALLLGSTASAESAKAQHYDVLIRGGMIYDGTDSAPVLGDVALTGDRIAAVGKISAGATANLIVSAQGKIVAPGFIDPHSHAAPNIETPELAPALPMLYQGITTIMVNPDGGGPADLTTQIANIQRHPSGVNVIPLIGHNAVREAVMGVVNRPASADEQAQMENLVNKAMKMGAFGLSSGPFYVPGKYSNTTEIIGLAKVAARFPHSFYTSHIRDESNYDVGVAGAVDEVISIAREAKLPSIITHIKVLGPQIWGQSAQIIDKIEAARAEGLPIWADQYPYTASGSSLMASLVPGWAQEGGSSELAKRLADPTLRAKIRAEMIPNLARRAGPTAIMIRSFPANPKMDGQTLDVIGGLMGMDPLDAAIEMLKSGHAVPTVSFNMSDDDVKAFMRKDWVMTTTDGGLPHFGKTSEHPRAYGAFPRKLRNYVLDEPVLSMQQAIHRATGLTAQVFHVVDRGKLQAGFYGDVIVFDLETVRDTATYTQPHSYAVGMDYVFVNGKAAVAVGKAVDQRYGKLILRSR
jgi:N-acyl-D-amino-acid deacylase